MLIDYPPPAEPRWGFGHPSNEALSSRLESSLDPAMSRLRRLGPDLGLGEVPDVADISGASPSWTTGYMSPLDAATLCAIIADIRPSRYVEIGSGTSTKFARRAVTHSGVATSMLSIDPHPRSVCDELCDEIIRADLQTVDLSRFDDLESGDVVFFDGSHRALSHSDVAVFFLELLPRLAEGVVVHVHDIFLPNDYPEEWNYRFYSEQYLVGAMLLANPSIEVLSANHLLSVTRKAEIKSWWEDLGVSLPDQPAYDNSLWFRVPATSAASR